MNKRNAVAKLGRTHAHRKAMMRNMAVSLFDHERIITTRAKAKVLRSHAETLITRARHVDKSNAHALLHNRRLLLRHIPDRNIVKKLLEDIAPRFADRPGGYLRMIHLPERKSDVASMSIVELVDRRERPKQVTTQTKGSKSSVAKDDSKKPDKASQNDAQATDKKNKQDGRWYSRFTRKRKEWD